MKRRGGCLWLLVGLFLAIMAGGLAFVAMLRATSAQTTEPTEPRAQVVIVTQDVPQRTEIQAGHVRLKDIPISAIPDNAVRSLDAAIGKVTSSPLVAGEILLQPRLADPGQRGPQVAFGSEPGKVVMAFPASDLMSHLDVLRPGDTVDILFSIDITTQEAGSGTGTRSSQDKKTVTFSSLQNVRITAIVLSPDRGSGRQSADKARPAGILLALDPQDALVIKHLKDIDGIVDIVLRAPEDDTRFDLKPVDDDYLKQRYQLKPELLP